MSVQYSAVPNTELTQDEQLNQIVKTSGRIVAFICIIQLLFATVVLLAGNSLVCFIVTAVFVSIGLTGVIKRRYCLVIAHFVFSVVAYVFTLIALVVSIIYCDDCSLFSYCMVTLLVIVESVGLKHSKLLICALRALNPACARQCALARCEQAVPAPAAPAPPPPAPVATAPPAMLPPMYGMYSPTNAAVPSFPQYPMLQSYPMQPMPMYPYAYPPQMYAPQEQK